ncbi:MAG: tetratricopeptide repeat protein [Cyanobacteria bacterium P01_C01_bin.89]
MTDSPVTDSGSDSKTDPANLPDSTDRAPNDNQLPQTELEKELAEDRKSQARGLLQRGKAAYESGRYRDAINTLETAAGVMQNPISPLGGEISVWLVTAYEALGLRDSALGLCRKLCTHPDFTVRKQARRLLEILEAPQLNRPKEWMTEIPDLSSLEEDERSQVPISRPRKNTKSSVTEPPAEPPLPPEERRYNDGLFWAIALGVLTVGLAAWAVI